MASLNALIGCWYKDLETGQQFEVVATDEGLDTIEVQLIDGEICEYDLDSWRQLKLTGIEEPEDWRNAFELRDELVATDVTLALESEPSWLTQALNAKSGTQKIA